MMVGSGWARALTLLVLGLSMAAGCSPSARADPPVERSRYPWLAGWDGELPPMVPLEARFTPPSGFTRPPAEGFAAWLRGLPIRTDRAHVLSYTGERLYRPSAAVAALDVGRRNLQQCADTAYRLHAEYLWASGAARRASYHFTSGDRSSYADWLEGERFKLKGRGVRRLRGARRANTHETYRGWLSHLFLYAGTRSIKRDSSSVGGFERAEGGDVLVQPGGPGHAVIILDIAEGPGGERVALLGQGFMPAEDLHVLTAPWAREGVWFPLSGEEVLTPSWPKAFAEAHLRRFKGG